MAENSEAKHPEVEKLSPVKDMTVEQFTERLLKKILADCGLTLDQLIDEGSPTSRVGYNTRASSKNAKPMPTPDEEADLMAARANINLKKSGMEGIVEFIRDQRISNERANERRRLLLIVRSAPWYLRLTAKTILFFKNLFKRSK